MNILKSELIKKLLTMVLKRYLPFIDRSAEDTLKLAETAAYINFQIKDLEPELERMKLTSEKIAYEAQAIERSIQRHPIKKL